TLLGGAHTVDVLARAISVSGITAQDRVYDGTSDAIADVSDAQFSNFIDGDDLTVSATALVADRNAGDDERVTLSSTYGGADLGNYVITDQASTTASIARREISVNGITAADRVYDGTTDATVDTSGAAFVNSIAGDDIFVLSASGDFSDRNAG